MNVTTNAILVAMVMISVTKRVGVFTPRPGKNARQNFSFKGAQIFLYWYNDHKTIFAHNRGDMHCIKSHIHFQVSPSTSEIFNKNLKIGRFYPGLPYICHLCRTIKMCYYKDPDNSWIVFAYVSFNQIPKNRIFIKKKERKRFWFLAEKPITK